IAETLEDHLPGGRGGDPAEVGRGVVVFADDIALLVTLRGQYLHSSGLAIQMHPGAADRVIGLVVGVEQRLLQGDDQDLERDLLVPFDGAQHRHVDVHQSSSSSSALRLSSTWTWARTISAYATA